MQNGASVSINEISSTTGSAGGCTLNNVPIGAQTIIVTASGYENYSETINVSNENITFEIKLNKEGE
ncbi:MAG: PEGA domain-containing protein [Methanobrevibacter sp.]|uniref:PEGA domain-containing protein n=1 Tax=Methanobrevibacter sp. TaxID=66852 RepID=UPI003F031BBA